MSRLVAIHQPNFLPWLGFFDKLARADVMVLLDDVQFQKKGGTWTNRTRLLMNGEPTWLTVPVDRSYSGTRSILEMRINETTPWREKARKTLAAAYGRAPAFDEAEPLVAAQLERPTDELAELNDQGIRDVASALGLDAGKIVRSSELDAEGAATDLLISITGAVGGDAYLAGGGAAGYQQDEKFAEAGIDLVTQDFRHPVYDQAGSGEFVAGLSVVDALMALGAEGTGALLSRS